MGGDGSVKHGKTLIRTKMVKLQENSNTHRDHTAFVKLENVKKISDKVGAEPFHPCTFPIFAPSAASSGHERTWPHKTVTSSPFVVKPPGEARDVATPLVSTRLHQLYEVHQFYYYPFNPDKR